MKNKIFQKSALHLMFALGAMGLSVAACSTDEALDTDEAKAVNVSITTRTGGGENSPWQNGDQIVLQSYMNNNDNLAQAVQYTLKDGSQWTGSETFYWLKASTTDFLGYYPTTATSSGLAFAIPTDQSDAAKLHAADYMTTDRLYGQSYTGSSVDLEFQHRLVKVVMNVTISEDFGNPDFVYLTDVAIPSQSSAVKVTINKGAVPTKVVGADDTSCSIQPYESAGHSYVAYVAPGTLVSGTTPLMFLKVNDESRQATYNGSLTALESGKAYTFKLTITPKKVEVTSIEVDDSSFFEDDWSDEEDIE